MDCIPDLPRSMMQPTYHGTFGTAMVTPSPMFQGSNGATCVLSKNSHSGSKTTLSIDRTASKCSKSTMLSSSATVGFVIKKPEKKVEKKRAAESSRVPQIAKPKRPLTAYNLFFRSERAKMIGAQEKSSVAAGGLCDSDNDHHQSESSPAKAGGKKKRLHRKTHGKIGFQEMAKVVGQKWKLLDATAKAKFEREAADDIKRYRKDMEVYRQTIHVLGLNVDTKTTNNPKKKKISTQPYVVTSGNQQPFQPAIERSSGSFIVENSAFSLAMHRTPLPPMTVSSGGNVVNIVGRDDAPKNMAQQHRRRDALKKALELCDSEQREPTLFDCQVQSLANHGSLSFDLQKDLEETMQTDIVGFMSILDKEDGSSSSTNKPAAASAGSAGTTHKSEKPQNPVKHDLDFEPLDLSVADDFEDDNGGFFETLSEDFSNDLFFDGPTNAKLDNFDRNVKSPLNRCETSNEVATECLWDLYMK